MNNRKRIGLVAAAVAVAAIIVALILMISSKAQRRVAVPAPPPEVEEPEPPPPKPPPPKPKPAPAPEQQAEFVSPHDGELRPAGVGFRQEDHPKDPYGPERDWRDFNPDEKAAQSSLEHDTADFGEVIARLEQGAAIEKARGTPVTPEEQEQLHEAIGEITETYEQAYNSAYSSETSIVDFADAMRGARATFDKKVKDIYGLTDDQFYDIFPYRRDFISED